MPTSVPCSSPRSSVPVLPTPYVNNNDILSHTLPPTLPPTLPSKLPPTLLPRLPPTLPHSMHPTNMEECDDNVFLMNEDEGTIEEKTVLCVEASLSAITAAKINTATSNQGCAAKDKCQRQLFPLIWAKDKHTCLQCRKGMHE